MDFLEILEFKEKTLCLVRDFLILRASTLFGGPTSRVQDSVGSYPFYRWRLFSSIAGVTLLRSFILMQKLTINYNIYNSSLEI